MIAVKFALVLGLNGCRPSSTPEPAARTFAARGIVITVPSDGKTVVIQHEAISNYMAAMTMPFEVKDTNDLRGLQPGDRLAFRLNVTPQEGWIDHLTKLNRAPQELPSREMVHFAPAVAGLVEGDLLPNFHFTNELGQAVDLEHFRGQPLAFTFFFTSCPFPNYCPRLTSDFATAAAKLRSSPLPPWHLFSISFDTARDTPAQLLAYAQAAHYDPAHWSFLTGAPATIQALADLFDERYWNENQTISHNLRTVVVDAQGRVRKIFAGSDWTSDELVAALTKTP